MRAGVAQLALRDEIGPNVERISAFIEQAANLKLDILCFPECSLTGYMRQYHDINKGQIDTALSSIHERAMKNKLNLIVGTPYFENDRLFNAAVLLRNDKNRTAYNKNVLTEFDKKHFAKGEGTLSFEVKGTKCGVLICRDQNSPRLSQGYVEEGVKVIFILAAHYYLPSEAWLKLEKNRALPIARAGENSVYVLKANAVGSQGTTICLGGSLIVSPQGLVISELDRTNEGIIYYEMS